MTIVIFYVLYLTIQNNSNISYIYSVISLKKRKEFEKLLSHQGGTERNEWVLTRNILTILYFWNFTFIYFESRQFGLFHVFFLVESLWICENMTSLLSTIYIYRTIYIGGFYNDEQGLSGNIPTSMVENIYIDGNEWIKNDPNDHWKTTQLFYKINKAEYWLKTVVTVEKKK